MGMNLELEFIEKLIKKNELSDCPIPKATSEDIEILIEDIKKYNVKIVKYLKDYFKFLEIFNGYNYDGVQIFSTYNYNFCEEKQSMVGIIEFYDDYRYFGTYKKYEESPFFVAKDGEVGYCLNKIENKYVYCRVFLNDPDNPEKTYDNFGEIVKEICVDE